MFVVASEDVTNEICNRKVSFRKTDRIYIFVHSENEPVLTNAMKEIMGGKEVFIEEANILDFFRERNKGNEEMYFIGKTMEEFFQANIDDIMLICAGAASHNSFGVSRVKLRSLKQQSSADYSNSLDAIADALASDTLPMDSTSSFPAEEHTHQERASPVDTGNFSPDTNSTQHTDSRTTKASKRIRKIPEKSREQPGESRTLPRPETEHPTTEVLRTPQKEESQPEGKSFDFSHILDEMKLDVKQEQNINKEVNDQKALMMAKLRERLNQHISEYIRQQMSIGEYFKFMMLILKCETHEEFNQSWKAVEPTIPTKLNDIQFKEIRFESAYYYRVSSVLFDEDRWSDERENG